MEAGAGERPVPIVSFVARQRDLRTVLGTQALGSEVKNFEDQLNYLEGRFGQIKLDDEASNGNITDQITAYFESSRAADASVAVKLD